LKSPNGFGDFAACKFDQRARRVFGFEAQNRNAPATISIAITQTRKNEGEDNPNAPILATVDLKANKLPTPDIKNIIAAKYLVHG